MTTFASSLEWSARIVTDLLVTPILVGGLGPVLFGIWRVLYQTMGYASAAGGRSAQALKMVVASQQNSKDDERKREYVGAAAAVWLLFLPVSSALGVGVLIYLPELLDTPAGLLTPVRLAIAVLIANSIVAGLAEIPKAVLGGENQGYRRMGLSALVVVVTAGLTAAAIGADAGIFGVALAAATGTLLNMALFVGIAKRHIPWFGMKRPSGEALRWFGSKSVGFFLWKWINQFLMQGDVLLIGIFGSPTMVTVYSLSKHVPDALGRLTGFAVSGSAAGFGRLVAEHRLTKVRRVRGELMIATWLLVVVCGSVALVWTPSFVRLWVGAGFETEPATLVLILALAGQLMFIRTDSTIIDSTLNLGRKLALGAISVAVTVALVALIPHQERTLSTFCIAFLVGRLPVSLGYAYIVGQVTEHSVHEQAMAIARPAAVGVVLLAAAANLQELAVATGWLPLAASVVLTLLLASLVALPAGLNSIQRERLLGRLRALI